MPLMNIKEILASHIKTLPDEKLLMQMLINLSVPYPIKMLSQGRGHNEDAFLPSILVNER